ncbi:hypothetical protein Dimus_036331 [Dionaea muscipula]
MEEVQRLAMIDVNPRYDVVVYYITEVALPSSMESAIMYIHNHEVDVALSHYEVHVCSIAAMLGFDLKSRRPTIDVMIKKGEEPKKYDFFEDTFLTMCKPTGEDGIWWIGSGENRRRDDDEATPEEEAKVMMKGTGMTLIGRR